MAPTGPARLPPPLRSPVHALIAPCHVRVQFNVPDHAYYWLWPGGRFDQVRQAAFKQDVGHNPRDGMDTCPPRHHLGFFHNWDEAHVDSWGCLPDVNELPVLCCRRG